MGGGISKRRFSEGGDLCLVIRGGAFKQRQGHLQTRSLLGTAHFHHDWSTAVGGWMGVKGQ